MPEGISAYAKPKQDLLARTGSCGLGMGVGRLCLSLSWPEPLWGGEVKSSPAEKKDGQHTCSPNRCATCL